MATKIPTYAERSNKRSSGLGKLFQEHRKEVAKRARAEQARISATSNAVRAVAGAPGRAAVPASSCASPAAPALGLQRPDARSAIHARADPAAPRDLVDTPLDAELDELSPSSKRFKTAAVEPALSQGPRPSVGTAAPPAPEAYTALLASCLPPPTPGGARGAEEAAAALQEASQPAAASRAECCGHPLPRQLAVRQPARRGRCERARDHCTAVLKWAGSKKKLVDRILQRLPAAIGDYYEPFLGGGSVLIALLCAGRILGRVFVGDANPRLINTYKAIRDNVEDLVRELAALMSEACDEATYYARREQFNAHSTAALMLFLNATCKYGLYRENGDGGFNTPFLFVKGSNKRVQFSPEQFAERADNLRALSALLQKHDVQFVTGSWTKTLEGAGQGATVYLDPPYEPLADSKSSFTDYVAGGFKDHTALLTWARSTEARVLYSNHDTEAVVSPLRGWAIDHFLAPRAIRSKTHPHAQAKEILASNFRELHA